MPSFGRGTSQGVKNTAKAIEQDQKKPRSKVGRRSGEGKEEMEQLEGTQVLQKDAQKNAWLCETWREKYSQEGCRIKKR